MRLAVLPNKIALSVVLVAGALFSTQAPAELLPGTVIYGAVPPLFGRANPLKASGEYLDSLRDLGVNVIWLSPVNQTNDPSLISYAVTDHFKLRADFGSGSDLRSFVSAAKKRNLRVIMDFVANHVSSAHPYFQDTLKLGRSSEYYDYFERDSDGNATHYFDWNQLPNLNYSNPKVRAWITKAFEYWTDEYGVDGFRVDAAWGVRERAPDFWPTLIKKLRTRHPNLLLLAEASARDPYYIQSGFDLAYDWTQKLGQWSWSNVFGNPSQAGRELAEALGTEPASSQLSIARYLNNNDTGLRFVSRYGLSFTRMAAVLQFTLPGVPIVYMGDEVAAEFDPSLDPSPIQWKDPNHFRSLYKTLIDLRKKLPGLAKGQWEALNPERIRSAYAYARYDRPELSTLIALNFGARKKIRIAIPAKLRAALGKSRFLERVSNENVPGIFDDRTHILTIEMPARTAWILTPQAEP